MDSLTNRLTIFLLKENFTLEGGYLTEDFAGETEKIFHKDNEIGILYYGYSQNFPPSWLGTFFGKTFNNRRNSSNVNDYKIFNASSKALLEIEVEVKKGVFRTFIIVFGYGANLLVPGCVEERFGLKVVLNTVDPKSIRSVDRKNLTSIPKHTREQLSKAGNINEFGIDVEQDLVYSITGQPLDESFGKTITGKDSLSLSVKKDVKDIKDFLAALYAKFESDDYKKDFSWIDQIEEIKEPHLIKTLDDCVIERWNNNDFDKMWMAVPEVIDWENTEGFCINNVSEKMYPDLDIALYKSCIEDAQRTEISIKKLNNSRIYRINNKTSVDDYRWKAYDCLYCEVEDGENTYLLNSGKWYQIKKEFVKDVNDFFFEFKARKPRVSLPDCTYKNENEYNQSVPLIEKDFCCLDRKLIQIGGSSIEFCDLYSKSQKSIVHIKQYAGSSVLSHLFNQGIVSAEVFLSDLKFRKDVQAELPNTHKFLDIDTKPEANEHEIVFGIIHDKNKELNLPFFSKVALKNANRRLAGFGFTLSMLKVDRHNN